jgi:hypothetical protein
MGCYMAERYLPSLPRDELLSVVECERAAAAACSCRHLQTIYVPEDETCFTLFAAPSPEAIRDASERFDLRYRRIVIAIDALGPDSKLGAS